MQRGTLALATAAILLLSSRPALAQDDDLVGKLDEAMRRPHTVVDTALVVTNLGSAPSRVHLVAYDNRGDQAGSTAVEVPANGLALVLASEIVDDTDPRRFIGKVVARGGGRLAPSAVLFGGPLTDLPTDVQYGRIAANTGASQPYSLMTFPLVATY